MRHLNIFLAYWQSASKYKQHVNILLDLLFYQVLIYLRVTLAHTVRISEFHTTHLHVCMCMRVRREIAVNNSI